MNTAYLRLENITKSFPGVLANSGINLSVEKGEIHALLGENGAGKSTLMKILYGYYQQDSGSIYIEGNLVDIRTPTDAMRCGIGMVFQNFMLIPAFSVIENIALAVQKQGQMIQSQELADRIRDTAACYNLSVEPEAKVWELSIGEQQRVEILRLLFTGSRILIFDEPTSVLTPQEVEGFFEIARKLSSDGYCILFITHKLREVMALADRITVLRKGTVVNTALRQDVTESDLAYMLVGKPTIESIESDQLQEPVSQDVTLEFHDVFASGERGRSGLQGVSFTLQEREILGVAGVAGNGQTELGEVVLGLRPCSQGRIVLHGQDLTNRSTAKILEAPVAYIPEDPLQTGVAPGLSVLENMVLHKRDSQRGWRGLVMDWKEIRAKIELNVERFGLTLPNLDRPVITLSGGNIQRVVFVRELACQPRLTVAFHPTFGLDIAATKLAHELFLTSRSQGSALLLISEDLDELFALSDRIMVMHAGSVAGIVNPKTTQPFEVGLLMTGGATT
ncbi:MAG: ATP-binding cassette domain-containing protein [Nitrospirales bacterium]|nr:ATP-binding cassette domain-containing protein [Nitrospirales bacterium]